jgi:hypothetical protein
MLKKQCVYRVKETSRYYKLESDISMSEYSIESYESLLMKRMIDWVSIKNKDDEIMKMLEDLGVCLNYSIFSVMDSIFLVDKILKVCILIRQDKDNVRDKIKEIFMPHVFSFPEEKAINKDEVFDMLHKKIKNIYNILPQDILDDMDEYIRLININKKMVDELFGLLELVVSWSKASMVDGWFRKNIGCCVEETYGNLFLGKNLDKLVTDIYYALNIIIKHSSYYVSYVGLECVKIDKDSEDYERIVRKLPITKCVKCGPKEIDSYYIKKLREVLEALNKARYEKDDKLIYTVNCNKEERYGFESTFI